MAGYRIGFAHGVVTGLTSDPTGTYETLTSNGRPKLEELDPYYLDGLLAALKRPAVLVEAFDTKCADYRNELVSLDGLTVIAIAEMGGLPSSRVERALQAARSVQPDAHAVISVLKAK